MSFISQHKLKISTLSPIHIGCNETYEPTNYVLDEGALFAFDSISSMNGLSEDTHSRLLDIVCGKPNDHMLKEIQLFFYENRNAIIPGATHIIPVHTNIVEFYKKRIGKVVHSEGKGKNVINKLEIERTAFNSIDHSLFLPGSSIKGAIRTALLNSVNKNYALNNSYEKNRELQQRLFKYNMRTMEKDPMRLVSIADTHQGEKTDFSRSELYFAVNRKRNQNDEDGKPIITMAESKGLNQILESIVPLHFRLFETQLNLHKIEQDLLHKKKDGFPEQSLHWKTEDIVEACNSFYLPMFQREIELLENLDYLDQNWKEKTQEILSKVSSDISNNRAFLLRIGRHSGAEAETLNGVRKIKIMTKDRNKPRFEKEPTTFWLASHSINSKTNMTPFGWILVEVDPQRESALKLLFQDSENSRQKWQKEKWDFQLCLSDKIKQKKEEKKQQEFHLRQQQQKEEEDKNLWGRMNDEERDLSIIRGDKITLSILPNADPMQIVWPKFDSFSSEHKRAVALAFKEKWQTIGKWEGKLSKKQIKKVLIIKNILKDA
jgi:CRISPR-associated protein Csm5